MAGKKRRLKGENEPETLQHRLWNTNLVLAVLLFFILSVWWIGVEFKFFAAPDMRTQELLDFADLAAIGIFAVEFAKEYRKEEDKVRFFRKHWLGIIAILPFGFILRAARIAKFLELPRQLEFVARLDELQLAMPGVALSAKAIGGGFVAAHKWLAHYTVFTDVARLAHRIVKGVAG